MAKKSARLEANTACTCLNYQFKEPVSVGEIVISGTNVMKGYYKNKDLTENTLRNGRLHSGDLGYMDEENYLYVVGRKDNMFTSAGKNNKT